MGYSAPLAANRPYVRYETNVQDVKGKRRFVVTYDNNTALIGAQLLAAGRESEFWAFITSGIGVVITDADQAKGFRELDI